MSDRPLRRPTFFEPAAGAAILGVDWLCFGLEWQLGPVSMAVMSVAAFLSAFVVVRHVQLKAGAAPRVAMAKAAFGALAAGVPFPIAGTVAGALILALSGGRSTKG